METFHTLFGSLLLFVYHCFDRIVVQGYLPLLTRPEHIVHFFRDVHHVYPITKQALARRTQEYQQWVEGQSKRRYLITILGPEIAAAHLGAVSGIILAGPRVYYAMAEDGLLFKWMGAVHPTFRTPHLAIVDGIVGMEGDGPLNGTARHAGVILMGVDLVAVDATGARLMGLPAERIPHLALGAMKKLGRIKEAEIEQIGEPIAGLAQECGTEPAAYLSEAPVMNARPLGSVTLDAFATDLPFLARCPLMTTSVPI